MVALRYVFACAFSDHFSLRNICHNQRSGMALQVHCKLVHIEMVFLTATFATFIAEEWLLLLVDCALVPLQRGINAETQITDGALEGLLTSVQSRVLLFHAIEVKCLVAKITLISQSFHRRVLGLLGLKWALGLWQVLGLSCWLAATRSLL